MEVIEWDFCTLLVKRTQIHGTIWFSGKNGKNRGFDIINCWNFKTNYIADSCLGYSAFFVINQDFYTLLVKRTQIHGSHRMGFLHTVG